MAGRDSSQAIYLDPTEAANARYLRRRRFHTEDVPKLRLIGFTLNAIGVLLHNWLIFDRFSANEAAAGLPPEPGAAETPAGAGHRGPIEQSESDRGSAAGATAPAATRTGTTARGQTKPNPAGRCQARRFGTKPNI